MQKLKMAAYDVGYARGDAARLTREGNSLALWANTARKGGKGVSTGSLAYRRNIAAKLRQLRASGDVLTIRGYRANRNRKRNTGTFVHRKGQWKMGKGGRFVGSGG
jgi:hypothetical protein